VTVSRKEVELAILRHFAEADGEFSELMLSDERSIAVTKDLKSSGSIDGRIELDGTAYFRITSDGEERLARLEVDVLAEAITPPEDQWRLLRKLWKVSKWSFGIIAALVGFVWLMLSQVLAPSAYCPWIGPTVAAWLAPCKDVPLNGSVVPVPKLD
jgi:hypothetical protein